MRKLFTLFMALVLSLTYSSPVLAQSSIPVATGNIATVSLTDGQATSLRTDLFGRLQVAPAGTAPYPAPPVPNAQSFPLVKTTAVASSLVIQGTGNPQLLYLNVVSGASAGFVMVFPGNSAPADGAVTPSLCYNLAANSTLVVTNAERVWFAGGIVVVFSTTGCFTKTASATAFISGTSN